MKTYIGTAGWCIPAQIKEHFPVEGSHLQRYSKIFNCVEINSTFYKTHKPESFAKWATCVPDYFRFSVKLSRYFTHDKKLMEVGIKLQEALYGYSQLQDKLGVLLVQLPPSLIFNQDNAENFLDHLRQYYTGIVVWEPRHRTWSSLNVLKLFEKYHIHRVIADPEPWPIKNELKSLTEKFRYFRLHGSPEIYKSSYSRKTINNLKQDILISQEKNIPSWIIFDNTTFGFATENALMLKNRTLCSDVEHEYHEALM